MAEQLVPLVLFAVIATGSPGGATTLATASGARFGYRRSIPLILGIAATLSALVAVSGTGLASTLLGAPSLHLAVKFLGTVYLLWLASRILLAGVPRPLELDDQQPLSALGASMLLLINPKAWAMTFGVAASFSEISDSPVILAAALATVFATSAFLSLSVWALAGSTIRRLFYQNWHWHLFNLTMAVLLAASIVPIWV